MNYWIIIDDTEQGPYSIEQLKEIGFTADTPVWYEGRADWVAASAVDELAALLPAPEPPALPVETPPVPEAAAAFQVPDVPAVPAVPVPQAQPVPQPAAPAQSTMIYAPAGAIPPGYVLVAQGEPKCPPTYLVWAIICTIVCFLPFGICAIICAAKVSGHFKAGRLEKAHKMSERAALFIILSIVAWLIWMPFSVVFAML